MARYSNKKGIALPTLGQTILALVAFVIIFSLISVQSGIAKVKVPDAVCANSAAIKAKFVLNPGSITKEIHAAPLLCNPDTEIIIDGKDKTPEKIMTELLEKMANVWNIFGEGTYQKGVFSKDAIWVFNEKDKCFRYYIVEFKNLNNEKIDIKTAKAFSRKIKYSKKNTEFSNYFEDCGGGNCFYKILSDIEEGKKYAISYVDLQVGAEFFEKQYNGIVFSDLNKPVSITGSIIFGTEKTCEFVGGT